jgi:hypothetical protein
MDYNFFQHIHNFAIWAAARSVARNFTGTTIIREAIEEIGLPNKLERLSNLPSLDASIYDNFHREVCRDMILSLKSKLVSDQLKVTYGKTAKIVAIYIKTRYVLTDPGSALSKYAHPPIDAILLKSLAVKYKELGYENIKWTMLGEDEYFNLIHKLRQNLKFDYFWEVEDNWQPGR